MTTENLKRDVINKIIKVEEDHVIEAISRLLDFELEKGIFKFSAEQKLRILEGEEEYETGKVLSEGDANKEIEEWLLTK